MAVDSATPGDDLAGGAAVVVVTLDLDGIAAGAPALGWTVDEQDDDSLTIWHDGNEAALTIWADGLVRATDGFGDPSVPWAVVGPLYALIERHKTEG